MTLLTIEAAQRLASLGALLDVTLYSSVQRPEELLPGKDRRTCFGCQDPRPRAMSRGVAIEYSAQRHFVRNKAGAR